MVYVAAACTQTNTAFTIKDMLVKDQHFVNFITGEQWKTVLNAKPHGNLHLVKTAPVSV